VRSDDARRRAGAIRSLMTTGRATLTADDRVAAETALADLIGDGIVEIEASELRVTAEGKPFIRNVAAFFDTYLRAPRQGPTYSTAI
jgi:coproporphyrinogen III oxidase-like Fe-S oxidoreductase